MAFGGCGLMGSRSFVLKMHWMVRRGVAIKGCCLLCQSVEYWLLQKRRRVAAMDRSNWSVLLGGEWGRGEK